MESLESLIGSPEKIRDLVGKANDVSVLKDLLALNWASLCSVHPSIFQDLLRLTSQLLAWNRPSQIKQLLECLFRSIFELNLPKKPPVLRINDEIFTDLIDIKRLAYGILHKYSVGCQVQDNDKKFLIGLLAYHPTSQIKLKDMTGISIGIHKDGENETLCFMVDKPNESVDISYIKAIKGLQSSKEAEAEQEALADFQKSVNQVSEVIVKAVKDNPVMHKMVKDTIKAKCPHRTAECRVLKFFFKNLIGVTEKLKFLVEFTVEMCVEKLLEIEAEGDLDKFDQIMHVFVGFLHRNYTPVLFTTVLKVFKSHILQTFQSLYVQHIILNLSSFSQQNPELFLSLLIKEIFTSGQVLTAAGYLASYLLIHTEQTIICVKYLLYYCLKQLKNPTKILNVKHVLKYLIFLLAIKPEILNLNSQISKKLQKLLTNPINLLKDLPLQEGLDYTDIMAVSGYCGELCLTSLYLPFHCDIPEFKLCSLYFTQIPLFIPHKKRRRCMSIDLPKDFQIKRRSFSIDESKFLEKADCNSSITTVASYK